jgi:calcineurin-like phosphoesterase family protein
MSARVDYSYKDGSKIYFTSDTHFSHDNIIKFCQRPFETVEEMDKTLIDKWNQKVPQDGLVFHLGDFAWGGLNNYKRIREQLNGNIILIKGNHEWRNGPQNKSDYDKLFLFSTQQMFLEIEKRKIYLNHVPFLCYGGTYRKENDLIYQAFGHVHSSPFMNGKDASRLSILFPTQYDVGVDNNNFEPISWYELDAKIKEQIKTAKENENTDNT